MTDQEKKEKLEKLENLKLLLKFTAKTGLLTRIKDS